MKNHLRTTLLAAALLACSVSSVPALSPGLNTFSWSGSQVIPDNNASGLAFAFNISGGPLVVTNVTVDLQIAGGWNGDLYAYLTHGSGFAVLLNRVGSTAANPGGSGVAGLNVEFSDSYLTDIHTALNNPLTGNFAPDGRNTNPFAALDTDPRSAFLNSFNGLDPNGTWTLFIADVSPLATATLQGWSVNLGVTVPEPAAASLAALACAVALGRRLAKSQR